MAVKKLDVRGEICPDPLTLTTKEMEGLGPGDHLKVILDSPVALETLHLCRSHKHRSTEASGALPLFLQLGNGGPLGYPLPYPWHQQLDYYCRSSFRWRLLALFWSIAQARKGLGVEEDRNLHRTHRFSRLVDIGCDGPALWTLDYRPFRIGSPLSYQRKRRLPGLGNLSGDRHPAGGFYCRFVEQ